MIEINKVMRMDKTHDSVGRYWVWLLVSLAACSNSVLDTAEDTVTSLEGVEIRSNQDSIRVLRGTKYDPVIRIEMVIENRTGRSIFMLGKSDQPSFIMQAYVQDEWVTVDGVLPVPFFHYVEIKNEKDTSVYILFDGRTFPQYSNKNISGRYRFLFQLATDPNIWNGSTSSGIEQFKQHSEPIVLNDLY